ncbi:MAG: hypothetical protein RL722_679 [Pseudomonadota bacterium]
MSAPRPILVSLLLVILVALGGCATTHNPDPLEKVNRKVFAFNDALDDTVLRPAAEAYQAAVPRLVRTGLNNFFGNVKDAWSAVNLALQGRIGEAGQDMLRFSTNTVFGIYGLLDIASEMGLEKHNEDFGMTLGRWGFAAGPYIVWPVLGSSTVRDSIGLPVDMMAAPDPFIDDIKFRNTLTATRIVSTRANLLKATRVLDDIALDRYSFVRDAYLQRRRSLIYNGEPPDAGGERYDLPEGSSPPVAPPNVAPAVPMAPAEAPSVPASGNAPGLNQPPTEVPASAAAASRPAASGSAPGV